FVYRPGRALVFLIDSCGLIAVSRLRLSLVASKARFLRVRQRDREVQVRSGAEHEEHRSGDGPGDERSRPRGSAGNRNRTALAGHQAALGNGAKYRFRQIDRQSRAGQIAEGTSVFLQELEQLPSFGRAAQQTRDVTALTAGQFAIDVGGQQLAIMIRE